MLIFIAVDVVGFSFKVFPGVLGLSSWKVTFETFPGVLAGLLSVLAFLLPPCFWLPPGFESRRFLEITGVGSDSLTIFW